MSSFVGALGPYPAPDGGYGYHPERFYRVERCGDIYHKVPESLEGEDEARDVGKGKVGAFRVDYEIYSVCTGRGLPSPYS